MCIELESKFVANPQGLHGTCIANQAYKHCQNFYVLFFCMRIDPFHKLASLNLFGSSNSFELSTQKRQANSILRRELIL